mmetsp:Transcript_34221/g.59878  ORF Transcript_34221/g.59878 Transcript_34221/m.59878 type:complete len:1428 (-) Transcript_34221:85-4368(-)
MALLLLLAILSLASAAPPTPRSIVQKYPFNARTEYDLTFEFYFGDFVKGNNLTFAYSFNYTSANAYKPVTIAEAPYIYQGLTTAAQALKSSYSSATTNLGNLVVMGNYTITPETNSISVWLSQGKSLTLANTIPSDLNVCRVSQGVINSTSVVSAAAFNTTSLKLSVYNATALPQLSLLSNITVPLSGELDGAYDTSTAEGIETYLVYDGSPSDQVVIYKANTTAIVEQGHINATTLGVSNLDVVYIGFWNSTVIVVDKTQGVFAINNNLPTLISFSQFGNLLNGYVSGNNLTITAELGLIQVSLPSFSILNTISRYLHTGESLQLFSSPFLYSSPSMIVSYETSNISNSYYTTIRVYDTSTPQSYVLMDVGLNATAANPAPQCAVIKELEDSYETFYIYVNYYSSLTKYLINNPRLLINSGMKQPYFINGNISVTNSEQYSSWQQFSFNFEGLNSSSYQIYPGRGLDASEGYINATSYEMYLNYTSDLWLPVSNYFSGNNLTFSTALSHNNTKYESTLYPKSNQLFQTNVTQSSNPAIGQININGTLIVAASSCLGNSAQIYSYDQKTGKSGLNSTITASESSFRVINLYMTNFTQQALLLLESVTQNATTSAYTILWDFFNVTNTSSPVSLGSFSFISQNIPSRNVFAGTWLYSLFSSSNINIFNVSLSPFSLTEFPSINQTTTGVAWDISDIAATQSSFYFYDSTQGLVAMRAGSLNGTLLEYFGIIDNKLYPTLGATDDMIFIMSGGSGQITRYIPGKDSVYNSTEIASYPDLCAYSDLAVSQLLVTVQCDNQVLIFETTAPSYSSLYKTIQVSQAGQTAPFGPFISIYAGSSISAFEFRNYLLNATSDLVPINPNLAINWNYLKFNHFQFAPKNVTFTLKVSASNSVNSKSTDVRLFLKPTGDLLTTSPAYLFYNTLLTGGSVRTYDTTSVLLANDFFVGQNFTFAIDFYLAGLSYRILPTSNCSDFILPVCIESKSVVKRELADEEPTAFDYFDDLLYVASLNSLKILSNGVVEYSYNLTEVNSAETTLCYEIKVISSFQVAVACREETFDSVFQAYVAVLNLEQPLNNTSLYLTSLPLQSFDFWTSGNQTLLYTVDGWALNVFEVIDSSLQLQTTAEANTLDLADFDPISVTCLSSTKVAVADLINGVIVLSLEDSLLSIEQASLPADPFTLYSTYTVTAVESDSSYVYASTSDGHLYTLDPDSLEVVRTVYDALGEWVFEDSLSVINEVAAVPVVYGNEVFLNVYNLTAPLQSALYTSYSLGTYNQLQSAPVKLSVESENSSLLLCAAYTGSNAASEVEIRLNTFASFSQEFIYNDGLANLNAFNLFSSSSYDNFTVITVPSNGTSLPEFTYDEPTASDWNKWWIWTLIMIGAILVSLLASAIFSFFFPSDKETYEQIPPIPTEAPVYIDRMASTVNPL